MPTTSFRSLEPLHVVMQRVNGVLSFIEESMAIPEPSGASLSGSSLHGRQLNLTIQI